MTVFGPPLRALRLLLQRDGGVIAPPRHGRTVATPDADDALANEPASGIASRLAYLGNDAKIEDSIG